MNWVLQLGYNLLSIILLAKKGIEMFLRKTSQLSRIIADDKVFGLAHKIENQYIIRLAKSPKPAIVNQVTSLIIET